MRRACPGASTSYARQTRVVDGRVKPGHDDQFDRRTSAPPQRSQTPLLHRRRSRLPTSRSRISLTACSPPRTGSPRASASRSAITCSISGSSHRTAGSMSSSPAVFAAPQLNPFMALGPKVWSSTRARISELLRHDHPELRDNEKLAQARAGADGGREAASADSRSPATPISIRRRSTPPMSASCSAARTMRCSRTGCTCRSATTAAPRPSWSAARRCAGRAGS